MNTDAAFEEVEVSVRIHAPLEKVWDCFTLAENITQWNFASDDWHCPHATNDLRPGGAFSFRMEAKDGSFGFDLAGEYTAVQPMKSMHYMLGDGRKVAVVFTQDGNDILVSQTFDAEKMNPVEMQRAGWQAILDNYKKYAEK